MAAVSFTQRGRTESQKKRRRILSKTKHTQRLSLFPCFSSRTILTSSDSASVSESNHSPSSNGDDSHPNQWWAKGMRAFKKKREWIRSCCGRTEWKISMTLDYYNGYRDFSVPVTPPCCFWSPVACEWRRRVKMWRIWFERRGEEKERELK
ncbi:hypothetical protein NC652_029659 [Populus alba x Populus x berolinensis]|nr:hypothetical protein NC652_029659 [Populus alba x Populus x berolinensis]